MQKKARLAERIYCMQYNCIQSIPLPVHHDEFRQWSEQKIFDEIGWYISPSWDSENGWDGMVFCPDHEVDGEDFASDYEDNLYG